MLKAELRVVEGAQAGTVIPLATRKFLIGREQDCQLRPSSDRVSRHHCAITVDDYTVRIRDMGSTNGTFVNGAKIEGTTALNSGDRIQVGNLVFEVAVQTAAIPAGVASVGGPHSGVPALPVAPVVAETSTQVAGSETQTELATRVLSADATVVVKGAGNLSPADVIRAKLAARKKNEP